MIKLLVALVFISCFALHSYAQSEITKISPASIFAEFGAITNSDLAKKLDAFLKELRKDEPSQGYIINYGSPRAMRARRNQILKNWWSCRDCGEERVTFVDGPIERRIRTVIWIVPPGAEKPIPSASPK